MAKAKRKSSGARFGLGMLIYALLFILLVVMGMRLFWGFIAEYEATRENHAVDAYLDSMDEEHIRRVSEPFLSTLDAGIQNAEQGESAVETVMRGELRAVRQGGESSANRAVYKIFSGDREIGRMAMTRPDNPFFGFSSWTVVEESYDFSWLLDSDEITVPEGWTVSVGGTKLDNGYVTERGIPYAYLKDFYGKGLPELYQCTYRIDQYIGDAPFALTDELGRPADPAALDEDRCLDNCTDEEKAAQESYVREFLPYYVECLANTRRNATDNYNRIRRFLVENGDLDVRLRGAIAGQYYAHSAGETIVSVTMLRHIHLGGEYYLVEFSYELDSRSQWEAQPTRSDNHAQIILRLIDGRLLAQSIYSL